jgi:hypothetical protein
MPFRFDCVGTIPSLNAQPLQNLFGKNDPHRISHSCYLQHTNRSPPRHSKVDLPTGNLIITGVLTKADVSLVYGESPKDLVLRETRSKGVP